MMRWRCICLLSIPCAAAAAPNATFGALADRVVWARINGTGSYDWPGSTLRHFTPVEAFDLLRGRHVLVLGNSVARHVVIALHLLIRGRAPEVHRIKIGGHALPAVESSVWERHGAASAELTPKQKYVSNACRRVSPPKREYGSGGSDSELLRGAAQGLELLFYSDLRLHGDAV